MGLYFTREVKNGATISVWEIIESEEELFDMSPILDDELGEFYLIKSKTRRKERLAVRALLNTIFGREVRLGYHDNGRPYLRNNPVSISIAHTGRFVCIITHPEKSVGIDIESLKRNYSSIERRVLSEKERREISRDNRKLHLACIWSAKEAVFKRVSLMGIDFANQIEVGKFSPRECGEIEALFVDKDRSEQKFDVNYELFENHVMTWIIG